MTSTRRLNMEFVPGECVLCFEPDLSKARVLYDAKVLDVMIVKDRKGRRKTEYMVHFQGWNSSWDRVVPGSYVIKNSDKNRSLMKRLAEIARHVKRNKVRMRRIDNILKKHFKKRPKFDSDSSSSETSSTDTEESDDDVDDGEDDEDDDETDDVSSTDHIEDERMNNKDEDSDVDQLQALEDSEPKHVELDLPGNLRRILENDCMAITRRDKLIKLPADPNIITILEGYVKNFGVNVLCATVEKRPHTRKEHTTTLPEKNIDICKEVVDGLRVFFDFALPAILLYNAEKEQYSKLAASKEPLAIIQSELGDNKNTIQTPGLLSHTNGDGSGTDQPPAKHPRLSPRAIKQEEVDDYSDDEEGPPRRITRKAFAEELRRSSLKGAESPKAHPAIVSTTIETPESSTHRRGRLSSSTEPKKTEKVTRSRGRTLSEKSTHSVKTAPPIKQEPQQRQECSHKTCLTDRLSPPPPLLLPGSVSSASSNVDTPTSSAQEQSLFRHRERAVNEIFSWKMLPPEEYRKVPTPPSLVYGAHHLLRLLVKLPQYLGQMPFPASRLQHVVRHLELLVEYFSTRASDLFPDSVYIDSTEEDED